MFILLNTIFVITCIAGLLMGVSLLLANKIKFNREKSSPFECGFDSNSSTRLPFSLRFFLITIIFLIFDVEVVILLPSISAITQVSPTFWWISMSLFISVLLLGLFHEWNQGALKWSL